jgi:3-methyladenine DNA glycosylase AlkD
MSAAQAKKAMQSYADKDHAAHALRYFKAGKGEYAQGDRFIGVRVPDTRKVAKQFAGLDLVELKKLLTSPIHEHRLLALIILVNRFRRAQRADDRALQSELHHFYLEHRQNVNHWDLVDTACRDLVGAYLLHQARGQRRMLYDWAASDNIWQRRSAIIATAAFIRNQEYDDTLRLAKIFIKDEQDLIHKASGWMLRETGNQDRRVLEDFLDRHAAHMPRTMLRYAIEKLAPARRKHYLAMGR